MGYTVKQLKELTGTECYAMYEQLNHYIMDSYNVNQQWEKEKKDGEICLRYRRGGKTLCTVYFRRGQIGIMVIFGKEERKKFEESESRFSEKVRDIYYRAQTYHDACPGRACVLSRKLNDCAECENYPCETFLSRKGLSHAEADEMEELDVLSYHEYLAAFDNRSRLERRLKRNDD